MVPDATQLTVQKEATEQTNQLHGVGAGGESAQEVRGEPGAELRGEGTLPGAGAPQETWASRDSRGEPT